MDNKRTQLARNIEALCAGSRDENYTKYLEMLLLQLRQGRITEAYAAFELNRTYLLYQQRMGMLQPQNVQQPLQYVPAQNMQNIQQFTQHVPAQQYIQHSTQQYIQQPMQYVPPQNIQQSMQYVPQQQYVPPQYVPQPQQPSTKGQRKNMEFAVGAGVLSVVGILFVLTAFVLLSIHYMNGMLKGICLYVIAAAVLLFSELYLERKKPKFADGLTGLGICSLYLFTMMNYF